MDDYNTLIRGLEKLARANDYEVARKRDKEGLSSEAFLRLADIASQGFREIEAGLDERKRHTEQKRLAPSSMGALGAHADARLRNARIDLADLDRALANMRKGAASRREKMDAAGIDRASVNTSKRAEESNSTSAHSIAVDKLSEIRNALSTRIAEFENASALERAVVETQKEALPVKARTYRPSPVLAFFSNLFAGRKPQEEGIIQVRPPTQPLLVDVVRNEGGMDVTRPMLLEPVPAEKPQFPPDGEYVSIKTETYVKSKGEDGKIKDVELKVGRKTYFYDSATDTYYRRRYTHIRA